MFLRLANLLEALSTIPNVCHYFKPGNICRFIFGEYVTNVIMYVYGFIF